MPSPSGENRDGERPTHFKSQDGERLTTQDGERPAMEPSAVASRGGNVCLRWFSLASNTDELARLGDFLSLDERARAARFHFARDRDRFVAGRGQLREVLGGLLKVPPEGVRFAYGPQGKPALAHETDLRFNLSHSQDLALLAITENWEVGVDLEFIRADLDPMEIAPSVFSPDECAVLGNLPESERLATFYGYWTRKEAFIKALGVGFTRDTKTFTVNLEQEQTLEGYAIIAFDTQVGFASAIAVPALL